MATTPMGLSRHPSGERGEELRVPAERGDDGLTGTLI
jgi:hypothetical protein